jgi:hypothetical protein
VKDGGRLPIAHELRNEVSEELNPDPMSESRAEPDVKAVRDDRKSGMASKKGRRWEELRNSQEKRAGGSTRRSMLVREEGTQRLSKRC